MPRSNLQQLRGADRMEAPERAETALRTTGGETASCRGSGAARFRGQRISAVQEGAGRAARNAGLAGFQRRQVSTPENFSRTLLEV